MKYPQIQKKEIQTKNSNIKTKTLIYFLQNYKKRLLQLFLANYLQNEMLEKAKEQKFHFFCFKMLEHAIHFIRFS